MSTSTSAWRERTTIDFVAPGDAPTYVSKFDAVSAYTASAAEWIPDGLIAADGAPVHVIEFDIGR